MLFLLELKDHIVFSTEPVAFCRAGKVALFSVYFSVLNLNLRTISSYCPCFTFLVETEGGGGVSFFYLGQERGMSKNVYVGDVKKKIASLKNMIEISSLATFLDRGINL